MNTLRNLACAGLLCVATAAQANDAAASTAMGGIRLVREPRVSMLKERLFISSRRVSVEYEFLNESNADITTEVAFPIPRYGVEYQELKPRSVDDFRVWVDGREIKYSVDVKAELNGRDFTDYLRGVGIDPATFGHTDSRKVVMRDLRHVPLSKISELISLGLLRADDHAPEWTVRKTYHWQQTFPAGRVLRVRHQYAPITGWMLSHPKELSPSSYHDPKPVDEDSDSDGEDLDHWVSLAELMWNSCFSPSMIGKITKEAEAGYAAVRGEYDFHDMHMHWVDYILTTANTWKTPIADFELIVEVPGPEKKVTPYTSFCWDGPIERIDDRHFAARARNFVPDRELHVAFVYP